MANIIAADRLFFFLMQEIRPEHSSEVDIGSAENSNGFIMFKNND